MKTDEKLKKILLETDQAVGKAQVLPGLAQRVRKKAARGRNVKIAVSTAAAAVLVVAIGAGLMNSTPVNQDVGPEQVMEESGLDSQMAGMAHPTSPQEVADNDQQQVARLQAEIALLREEINARMAIVEGMIARQEQRNTLAKLKQRLAAAGDPMEKIQQQRERAAYTTVSTANYKYDKLDLKESAIKDYKRAIELFPKTIWAEQARKKLAEIQNSTKGYTL